MKKAVINILALASVLTTAGFLLDGDAKDPSVLTRITEYVAMLTIIFTILSGFDFGIKAVTKRLQIVK